MISSKLVDNPFFLLTFYDNIPVEDKSSDCYLLMNFEMFKEGKACPCQSNSTIQFTKNSAVVEKLMDYSTYRKAPPSI